MAKDLTALANGESHELVLIEAEAREAFNVSTYAAQVQWHNRDQEIHRTFQDAVEDNAERYRVAMRQAQRCYRDTTADRYEG